MFSFQQHWLVKHFKACAPNTEAMVFFAAVAFLSLFKFSNNETERKMEKKKNLWNDILNVWKMSFLV